MSEARLEEALKKAYWDGFEAGRMFGGTVNGLIKPSLKELEEIIYLLLEQDGALATTKHVYEALKSKYSVKANSVRYVMQQSNSIIHDELGWRCKPEEIKNEN